MKTEYSLEELREMARLTAQIKENLEAINQSGLSTSYLEEMRETTAAIVANLETIEEAEDAGAVTPSSQAPLLVVEG